MSRASSGTPHSSHSWPNLAPNHVHACAGSGPRPCTACLAPVSAAAIAPASSEIGCTTRSGRHCPASGTSSAARRGAAAPNIPEITVRIRSSGATVARSGATARNASSDSARLGPISQVSNPRRRASSTPSAPLATTTSCPASCAALASGSIGSRWPCAGQVVIRTRAMAVPVAWIRAAGRYGSRRWRAIG